MDGVQIMSEALNKTLISSDQVDLKECIIKCGFNCDCFILIFYNNLCQLYNLQAKNYLQSNKSIDPEVEFFYRAKYVENEGNILII